MFYTSNERDSFSLYGNIFNSENKQSIRYYWGAVIWNRLPLEVKTIDDLLLFKKTVYHMLMEGTLHTDFVM